MAVEDRTNMSASTGSSSFSMETTESSPLRPVQPKKWRNMVAYWLLGLCNNYGYVVMLSAAHDVIENTETHDPDTPINNGTARLCNTMSTGTILLADILPSLFVKAIAPFLPFLVHCRVLVVILLSCAGFLLVAFTTTTWMAILGVVSTSFASGLGELTFLAYSHRFDKSTISMWSSGTGGAGVLGAGSYAGLTAVGLSSKTSLLLMLIVPVVMGLSFWLLLEHPTGRFSCCAVDKALQVGEAGRPEERVDINSDAQYSDTSSVISAFYRKLCDLPPLFKYMIPVGLVYLFEYFINQGLFELIYFDGLVIDSKEQYRWYQLDYQIGVFISRSSASFFTVRKIWLMAVFQFLNVIIFTFDAIYFFIPSIWIVFVLILWEGTLGGAAYVNTYYRIANEVAPEKKEFSLSITTLADAIGIGLAGAISIPVHNVICQLPPPSRLQ